MGKKPALFAEKRTCFAQNARRRPIEANRKG
jgi:hypothetical protein